MNVNAYLERISYNKPVSLNYDGLSELVYHHYMAVPFENIDVQNQVPIILEKNSLYTKVVENKRGGYCYELNSLFYELLVALGFDVQMIMGRVVNGSNIGPEYDHLALVVFIKDLQYLVDVGFGDFSMKPLLISNTMDQHDGRGYYRITEHGIIDGKVYMKVEKKHRSKDAYAVSYYFSMKPSALEDFSLMNEYQQSHPDSHFVRNYICSKPTPDGRISILNNKAVFTYKNSKRSRIVNEEERDYIISKYFRISLCSKAEKKPHLDINS